MIEQPVCSPPHSPHSSAVMAAVLEEETSCCCLDPLLTCYGGVQDDSTGQVVGWCWAPPSQFSVGPSQSLRPSAVADLMAGTVLKGARLVGDGSS